jgi:hypothetical protein
MCFGWVGALESQTPSEWLTAQLAGYRLISSNQYHSAILVAGQGRLRQGYGTGSKYTVQPSGSSISSSTEYGGSLHGPMAAGWNGHG